MADRKEWILEFGAKDTNASSTADSLVAKLRALKAEARASGEKDIKKMFGGSADRLVENATGLLIGAKTAFALWATDLIAGKFAAITQKIREMKEQIDMGKASWRDLVLEATYEIPVLGSIEKAEIAIYELVTGSAAAQEKLNKLIEKDLQLMADQVKDYDELQKSLGNLTVDAKKRYLDATQGPSAERNENDRYADERKKFDQARDIANRQTGAMRLVALRDVHQAEVLSEKAHNATLLQIAIDRGNKLREILTEQQRRQAEILSHRFDQVDEQRSAERAQRDQNYEADRRVRQHKLEQLALNDGSNVDTKREEMRLKIRMEADDKIRNFQEDVENTKLDTARRNAALRAQGEIERDAQAQINALGKADLSPKAQRLGVDAPQLDSDFQGIADRFKAGQEPALSEARKTSKNTETAAEHMRRLVELVNDGLPVKVRTRAL